MLFHYLSIFLFSNLFSHTHFSPSLFFLYKQSSNDLLIDNNETKIKLSYEVERKLTVFACVVLSDIVSLTFSV